MGPCAGGAVYSPAITDFILMVKGTAHMFVTGPEVIRTVTHEEVTKEDLGGALTHASKSGVAHFTGDSDEEVLLLIRELLSYMPQNNMEDPPAGPTDDDPLRLTKELDDVVPDASQTSPTTCATSSGRCWTQAIPRGAGVLRSEHRRRLRADRRAQRGGGGQPAGSPGRSARHRFGRSRRPVSSVSATLSTSPWSPSSTCPGSSRESPGVRGHHPARSQAALRLCRSHRAQGHADHPQGLRRRLRRHEFQAHSRGSQLCLSLGRNRGDGARGRGQRDFPQGVGRGGRPRGRAGRSWWPTTASALPTPIRRLLWATSTRSSCPSTPGP